MLPHVKIGVVGVIGESSKKAAIAMFRDDSKLKLGQFQVLAARTENSWDF